MDKDFLVEQIIIEYLKTNQPIGSQSLKILSHLEISSATIRNYFKLLSQDGILEKIHISSGSIPTKKALINYWKNHLNPSQPLLIEDLNHFKEALLKYNLFCCFKKNLSNSLQEMINCNNRYLVLCFNYGECIIPFQNNLEKFIQNFLFLEIKEIIKIAQQVCAFNLSKKLLLLQNETENLQNIGMMYLQKLLLVPNDENFAYFTQGQALMELTPNLYFSPLVPENKIAIVQNLFFKQKEYLALIIGSLKTNYLNFFDEIKV